MNKKTKLLKLVILLLTTTSLFAQNITTELKKVRTAYLENKQLSFNVEVYSYAAKADKTPSLISKGMMKKNNDKYYSNFQNYELMVNGEKALLVDNESKTMSYYEYKLNKKKLPQDPGVNIDSLLLQSDSVVMRPSKDGLKHFTTFSKTGYIKQTEIYVDEQTNFIKHILYYYVASTDEFEIDVDRVEIFYTNIQTKAVDENFFTFTNYFKRVKETCISLGKYSGYKINCYNSKS